MIFCLIQLSLGKSFPFFRNNVEQLRSGDFFQILQNFGEITHIVSVDWPKIPEFKSFKKVIPFEKQVFQRMLVFLNEFPGSFSQPVKFSQAIPDFCLNLIVGL